MHFRGENCFRLCTYALSATLHKHPQYTWGRSVLQIIRSFSPNVRSMQRV
jgi:hypothetical protein